MTGFSDRIVAEARSWLGTPYHHQCAVKGAGTDCLGLLRGVWIAVCGQEPEVVPPYTQDWAEPSREEALLAGAERWLLRLPDGPAMPGDVLLFRMRDGHIAKHLGIAARREAQTTFIHAYSGHGVVESPLSMPWVRRIAARFVFPEGAS
jgi:NlpC/P60 family putative phage cell wall peptidase